MERYRGEFEATADFDLANNHIFNWTNLEDLPGGGAAEGQIVVWRTDQWSPENLDIAHLPIGGTLTISNLIVTESSSGISYTELDDVPTTFPSITHTHTRADITNFSHTHVASEITDFSTAVTEIVTNLTEIVANFVVYSITTLTTGTKAVVKIPADGTITSVEAYPNTTSTVTMEIFAGTYGDVPLDTTDRITPTSPRPGPSGADKFRDTTLTNWTKTVTAGDVWEFRLYSATTATRCTFAITIDRDLA